MATIPSIAVIPSGYKASKLYSVLPTDGSGDLGVVRAGLPPNFNATRVNQEGLIENVLSNVPRLDYSDGGCPSLLVEPQRTNLALRSEEFDNASWGKIGATISADSIISPSNILNADKLVEDSSTGVHRVSQQPTTSSGATLTLSVYAKSGERNFVQLRDASSALGAWFNLSSGTIDTINAGITATITPMINGWYRCSITRTTASVNTVFSIQVANATNVNSYTGDGTSGIYIWGAQLEQGSNASSYIPTVASTVTRNADVISKTGISDLIGQTEGTLFVDLKIQINQAGIVCLHENTTNNNRVLIFYNSTSNNITFLLEKAGVVQVNSVFNTPLLSNSFFKCAFVYNTNNCAFFINGVKVGTDISCETFSGTTISRLSLSNSTGSSPFFGNVKNLQVYKRALTDQEGIDLTTL